MKPQENQNSEAFVIEHNLRAMKLKLIAACETIRAAEDLVGYDCWCYVGEALDILRREVNGEQ